MAAKKMNYLQGAMAAKKKKRVSELADEFWHDDHDANPVSPFFVGQTDVEELHHGMGFLYHFANVSMLETPDGLVIIDCGTKHLATRLIHQIKKFSSKHVHTVIYTHGHIDHCKGIHKIDEYNIQQKGLPRPRVIGHENVAKRFDRYLQTLGYNSIINSRQFQVDLEWPSLYRYPDVTYRDKLKIKVGGVKLSLFHGKGETDDATWVWIPSKRTICSGDFFVWCSPNCGNPQKVQRYPLEWANALRKMNTLNAELLLPGHGPPVIGAHRVKEALQNSIKLLDTIVGQFFTGLNKGHRLNKILSDMKLPQDLLQKPYLKPTYDDPMFIVHNLWRRYAGWWDLNPAHLRPANDSKLGAEITSLVGGSEQLAERAQQVIDAGEYDVGAQLIEFASDAEPDNLKVQKVRETIYQILQKKETGLMAQSIYRAAAIDSQKKLKKGKL